MKYLLSLTVALLCAATMATASYAQEALPNGGVDKLSTEKLKSEADSSLFRLDLGSRCSNQNLFAIGIDSEHTCVTAHDTYECNETVEKPDGTKITRTKCTIDASTEETIETPVLDNDLKPILDPTTGKPLTITTTKKVADRRGYYGSLGDGRTIGIDGITSAFQGAATAAARARVFVLGPGHAYAAQGFGNYVSGTSGSPFQGMTVKDKSGNEIGQ